MNHPIPNSSSPRRVIVGMSGGVDSSVAALLLQQQGYTVEGLFMKNWEEDDGTPYCTAMTDLADAQKVCDRLGIPLHTANFASEYWDNVFTHFLAEYRAGRTPNPDILCNREIKFKVFLDYAKQLGAELIATGHYAQRLDIQGHSQLFKGRDPNKDQSYFLHAITGTQISHTLFPVGALHKDQVRQIASANGLATAKKKDSTGICFIGKRRFSDFLKTYLPAQPGPIETDTGTVIGTHQGLMYHTIGQRQGLKIGGLKTASEAPWYVLYKDIPRNTLIVGQSNQHPALFCSSLGVQQIYWINPYSVDTPKKLTAKIRYRQVDQACLLVPSTQGYQVLFETPQRAITPGQSIVFYQGTHCLGGGIIEQAHSSFCNPEYS